jgi:hypothetical protein
MKHDWKTLQLILGEVVGYLSLRWDWPDFLPATPDSTDSSERKPTKWSDLKRRKFLSRKTVDAATIDIYGFYRLLWII